jgi:hypothetical protein
MSSTSATDAASIMSVTALVIKQLENAAKDVSRQHIHLLADKYSFDAEEAIEWLDIVAPLSLEEKKMARKAKAEGDASSTDSKKKTIPLPWMGMVTPDCCQAIAYNYGLFTQCQKKKVGTFYCAACTKAAAETAVGAPPCGTIADRVSQPIWADYKDSKDRQPVPYAKVLYKLKISLDEAVVYASEKGIVIPAQHMGVYEPPVSKGKKAVDANGTEGLFDSLVENSSSGTSTSKGRKLSPEEKLEKEEKRKAEKAEKDAAAALKKQHESIAKSFAEIGKDLNAIMAEGVPQEIAQAAIDKHAEKEAKKAEAQAKRDAEKAIKKAEADAKKAEAKAQKDAEKEAKKKGTVKPAVAATPAPAPVAAVAAAAAAPVEQGVVVKRINAAGEIGKKGQPGYIYLRDSNNVVYDADTKEEIGIWNGTEIAFTSQIDEEEETL